MAIIAASTLLAYGKHASLRGPLEALEWFAANRSPGDSAAYASAVYHAAYAQADHRGRWSPTGYLTLGTAGVVLGAALVLSALWRRKLENPPTGAA